MARVLLSAKGGACLFLSSRVQGLYILLGHRPRLAYKSEEVLRTKPFMDFFILLLKLF